MSANLELSIAIKATPMHVRNVVSDLKLMPRLSPQARKVIARGGNSVESGAWTTRSAG